MITELVRRLHSAYGDFVQSIEPNFFLTMNFGTDISFTSACGKMEWFWKQMEREGLGRRWYKRRPPDRIVLLGFPERLDLNAHWHCVAHIPNEVAPAVWRDGPGKWKGLAPLGQFHQDRIFDLNKVSSYSRKRQFEQKAFDAIYVYGPEKRHAEMAETQIVNSPKQITKPL